MLGVRLSPERYGMDLQEVKEVCKRFIEESKIDFLDISLWDVFKQPEEDKYGDKSLLKHFVDLDFKNVRFTAAGMIRSGEDVMKTLKVGLDFVSIGHSGILHHDFPVKVMENSQFEPVEVPISKEYLRKEGLGEDFIKYMHRWPGFVEESGQ